MDRILTFYLAWVSIWTSLASATYRSIHISNADVCTKKTKFSSFISSDSDAKKDGEKLDIGEGAIIFQLKNPPISLQKNIRNKRQVCTIHIEAPDRGGDYGIMAHVEEMHMRQNKRKKDCVDFVQFGQDDIIPFVTVRKSKRLCGQVSHDQPRTHALANHDFLGYSTEPGENLLVWINLGGRRSTDNWPSINVVNLTLVITAYRKTCRADPKFRSCGAPEGHCVRKEYFCDRHYNCPAKSGPAADEMGCDYPDPETTPGSAGGPGDGSTGSGGNTIFGNLNILSWTLIAVCSGIALLLFVLVFCRAHKMRRGVGRKVCCCCALGPSSNHNSCEYSDGRAGSAAVHVRSVQELSRDRQQRAARNRGGDPQDPQNLYLPLTVLQSSSAGRPTSGRPSSGNPVGGGDDDEEEGPPAYHEIFPEGVPQEFVSFSQEAAAAAVAQPTSASQEGEPQHGPEISAVEASQSSSHNTSSQLLLNTQPNVEEDDTSSGD